MCRIRITVLVRLRVKIKMKNLKKLTRQQADKIEKEMRKLETDPKVTKTELRLFLQHSMPCGHAAGNLLTCQDPPYGCVICEERVE